MTRLSFAALSALVMGLVVSAPARADYNIVGFEHGHCEIWNQNGSPPGGDNWVLLAWDIPDYQTAWRVREALFRERICS